MGAQTPFPFPPPTQKPAAPPPALTPLEHPYPSRAGGTWAPRAGPDLGDGAADPSCPSDLGSAPTPGQHSLVGLAQDGGDVWGGAFSCSEEPGGDPHIHPESAVSSWIGLLGSVWSLALPPQGLPRPRGTRGGLHAASFVFGAVCGGHPGSVPSLQAGAAAVTFPVLNWPLYVEGGPPTGQYLPWGLAGLGNVL